MYLKTDSLGALEARDAVDSLFKKEDWTMPTADMSLGQWVEAWDMLIILGYQPIQFKVHHVHQFTSMSSMEISGS